MPGRMLGLDSTRVFIAAKTCAAIIVGYGLALRLQWNASYLVTTIIVLQTATWGATFSKASLRLAGTFGGAAVGLALVALCAHDRELLIVGMALLTGVCVWAMQSSTHQYAWMLVVVTSAVVGWPCAMDPLNAFQSSVDRVTAVTVGVLLSGVAQAVFWPVTAAAQFERIMGKLVEGCRDLLAEVRRGLLEQDMDVAAMQKTKAQVFALSTSLETTFHTACAESKRFHDHVARYEQLCGQLEQMFLAAAAICDAGVQCTRGPNAASITRWPTVRQVLDSANNACVTTIQQLSMSRDGSSRPTAEGPIAQDQAPVSRTGEDASEIRDDAAVDRFLKTIHTFREIADRVRTSLAEVESTGSRGRAEKTAQSARPPLRARLAKSALASLQVCLGACFFIVLDWPLGLQSAMIPVMIFAYMNAQLPVALAARTILLSVAAALPLAAVFHFLVMPGVDTFSELAPCLALLYFPFLYGVASHNPRTSLAAVVSVIIAKALISVSTTPPSYDFASFANTYIGMSGGFSLVLLLAYLFETRSPRRSLHKLVSASLLDAADYLNKLPDQSATTSDWAARAATYRKRSLGALGKMNKLSALVDYGQDPSIARGNIQSALRSLDALVVKLISGDTLRTATDLQADRMKRANAWCVESMVAIGHALRAQPPVTAQLPPNLDDLELPPFRAGASDSTSGDATDSVETPKALAAYYRSLVDAILDCQNKLESVNWKRWCQDYF